MLACIVSNASGGRLFELPGWSCILEGLALSCLCSESIPSVTEKSVIFVKELSFPQTEPTDDAFFNWNWAGACRGRRAGPGLLAGWDAGFLNCLG